MVAGAPLVAQEAASYPSSVHGFLKTYCATCHSAKAKAADLDLEALLDEKKALAEQDVWARVARKVRSGEMPPKGLPQPKLELKEEALRWFDARIAALDQSRKPDPGRVTARRLNRAEYNNTIRDLFYGMDLKPANDFPLDDSGYGFDNIGDVLTISPVLMEKYLAAADRTIRAALLPDPPKKVTVERYEPERSVQPSASDVPLMDGAFASKHRFPVAADYEFRINVKLRSGQTTKVHKIALLLDGKAAFTVDMPAGETKRFYDTRIAVNAGFHEVGAGFVSTAEDEQTELFFDNVEIRGPYNAKPPEPTDAFKRIFVCGQVPAGRGPVCARAIIGTFARRAWRRPLTAAEIEKLAGFYDNARREGFPFDQSIALALKAVLVSPHFLFRLEHDRTPADPSQPHPVTDVELASRLSYFLWASMPDEELLSLAEKNELRAPGALEAQVKRMLADAKAIALAENFAGQWLELRNLESVRPDPKLFPTFDRALREGMAKESILFFDAIAREDRSILDLVDGKFTFVNDRLARHYGMKGITGKQFRRIDVDGVQRGGVLTHASVLTVTSYPTRTSPVLRGLWVLENFLGVPPPAPPPNVPLLKEEEIGKNASLREQLEQHRKDPACAVCHNRMDALGFGLENYNAVGAWRTHDGKFEVDSKGTLPGGKSFSSPADLKQILRGDAEAFAHTLSEKMLTYALGRGLESYDQPTLRRITRDVSGSGYRFSSMILAIVNSPAFQMRRAERSSRSSL